MVGKGGSLPWPPLWHPAGGQATREERRRPLGAVLELDHHVADAHVGGEEVPEAADSGAERPVEREAHGAHVRVVRAPRDAAEQPAVVAGLGVGLRGPILVVVGDHGEQLEGHALCSSPRQQQPLRPATAAFVSAPDLSGGGCHYAATRKQRLCLPSRQTR